ncbi:fluoride efflux transporter CrcB [Salinisphaera hydrothermalis]|uniref:fluoride efflux transporter CrcB n=1 Tax=Salinisphaera hydrothermalis TaxID=563188 RepID=UPI003342D61E
MNPSESCDLDHSEYDPEANHSQGQTVESEDGAEYEQDETMPIIYSILAIALGAAIGANIRWLLGITLNAYLPDLPPGTLAANLLGAFLIGLAISVFTAMPELSSFWRLFVVTGFLGALTTFSTFSGEVFAELQAGRFIWGFIGIAVHVVGSLCMVGLGMGSFVLLRQMLGGAQ